MLPKKIILFFVLLIQHNKASKVKQKEKKRKEKAMFQQPILQLQAIQKHQSSLTHKRKHTTHVHVSIHQS